MMKFYTRQHQYYCGIDLHARKIYVCIMDQAGQILVHHNMPATPERLLKVIPPYLGDIVIAVEGIFTWYGIANFCAQQNIPFVLGHALYMRAIHGAKTKNDKMDSQKIVALLRAAHNPYQDHSFYKKTSWVFLVATYDSFRIIH